MSENKKKMSKALYSGKLPIAGLELDCAVLDDGTRVLTQAAVFKAFDRPRKGMNSRLEIDGTKMPPFLAAKNLESLIGKEILEWTTPVIYADGKQKKSGYRAEILPAMCDLYLTARRQEILTPTQMKFAELSEILLSAFAKVGIIALIDEATGFQYDRKHDALRILLEQYIAEGLQKWVKKFPDVFFGELDRLYQNEKTTSRTRPKYYGGFINTYIYDPIENGYVKDELNKKNIKDDGKRKARFHQWLTEFGSSQLTLQIGRVMGVMETCANMRLFKDKIARQKQLAIQPELFDTEESK
ncbi:MAG: P63C domain-containing protein [Desulfuromonadales bacterium]|nr:P63C domain-containing protein [Desulfuromonadales bacterium]